jgi:hypothetical protein
MWGNFIGHADDDLIAAALLHSADCFELPYYHAQQAIEKYMKALAIAIVDPDGTSSYDQHRRWCEGRAGHDLVKLASRCAAANPFYTEPATTALLEKVQEWGTCTRYPWVETEHYGKSGDDLPVIENVVLHLRGIDLPIVRDDYWLGMIVRGRHHLHPEATPFTAEPWLSRRRHQLDALNAVFRNVSALVRW